MIELATFAAQFAPLVAQFLKEQKDRNADASAAAFQAWLRDEVFPLMERQSAAIFASVISLRVTNNDRFDRLQS